MWLNEWLSGLLESWVVTCCWRVVFFLFQIVAFSLLLEDCSYFVGPPLGGHSSPICPTMCGLFFPFAGHSHPFGGCVHCIKVMSMSFRSCDKSMAHIVAQNAVTYISPLWRYVCLSRCTVFSRINRTILNFGENKIQIRPRIDLINYLINNTNISRDIGRYKSCQFWSLGNFLRLFLPSTSYIERRNPANHKWSTNLPTIDPRIIWAQSPLFHDRQCYPH